MVEKQAMSEFKFACPVCGQHITADSATSGGQVECPTCFRKIVIPQAPASRDSKLILSAAQVDPRKVSGSEATTPQQRHRRNPLLSVRVLALLLILALASTSAWLLRNGIFQLPHRKSTGLESTNPPSKTPEGWTLDLTNAPLQDARVTGRILGVRFSCDKVTFDGGVLSFFQNPDLPSERRIAVSLFAHRPERLAGKSFEIPHDRTGPRPKVSLEVRHAGEVPSTQTLEQNYALKMEFGGITEARLPGRIYLAISDEEKSFINGRFDAQIIQRAREAPKPRTNASPALQ
jgi:hypothetical protein